MIEQHRLRAHHVADGDDRERHAPGRARRRIDRRRAATSPCRLPSTLAQTTKMRVGVDRLARPDHAASTSRACRCADGRWRHAGRRSAHGRSGSRCRRRRRACHRSRRRSRPAPACPPPSSASGPGRVTRRARPKRWSADMGRASVAAPVTPLRRRAPSIAHGARRRWRERRGSALQPPPRHDRTHPQALDHGHRALRPRPLDHRRRAQGRQAVVEREPARHQPPAARAAFADGGGAASNAIPTPARPNCARRSRRSTGSTRRGSSTATARTRCCTSPPARSPGPGDEVIYVRYGFAVYEIATRRIGATPVIAPDKDYATDVDAILACVTERTRDRLHRQPQQPDRHLCRQATRSRGSTPACAPTSCSCSTTPMPNISTATHDDGGMALAETAPNVLVTRTFSKMYGLAAERIGWGYAAAPIIEAMHRIRLPFSITIAGTAAAVAALGDDGVRRACRARTMRTWRALVRGRDRQARQRRPARDPEPGEFRAGGVRGRADRRGRVQGADGRGLHRPLAARPGPAARACASRSAPRTRRAAACDSASAVERGPPLPSKRTAGRRADAPLRPRHHHRPRPDRLVDRARGARRRCRPCG